MKRKGKNLMSLFAVAFLALLLMASCKKDSTTPTPTKNIVQLAQSNSDLTTLVTALNAANLTSILSGTGPFTVFAPSNEAFAKLAPGVLDLLIANPTSLADVLKYHVVSGKVMSGDLKTEMVQTLLTGKTISVAVSGMGVKLNGSSNVTDADVQATNGVVHIIDEVLLPPDFVLPKKSIVAIASATPSLSILVQALTKFPDLVTALSGAGSYTVFAPTNDAFTALLGVIGQTSLNDIPESVIERLLKYHVIAGASLKSTDLTDGQMAATLLSADDKITVGINGTAVKINQANVITANIEASNGVVHIVDAVLVPSLEASIVNTIVEPAQTPTCLYSSDGATWALEQSNCPFVSNNYIKNLNIHKFSSNNSFWWGFNFKTPNISGGNSIWTAINAWSQTRSTPYNYYFSSSTPIIVGYAWHPPTNISINSPSNGIKHFKLIKGK